MKSMIIFYRLLLRLYPASFRELFADEMQSTFADLLRDRQSQGRSSLLLAAQETAVLPLLALQELIDERLNSVNQTTNVTNASPRLLRATSIITTIILMGCSLIVWLLFLVTPSGADVGKLVLMIGVFHAIMLVSLLTAFRFPAYGSVVVITSAATLAVIQLALLSGLGVGPAGVLLVGLWAAPYIALGLAFRRQQRRPVLAA